MFDDILEVGILNMTLMVLRLTLAFAMAAAFLASPGQAGNLLMNPSFEEPPVSGSPFLAFQPGETIGASWVVKQTATQTVVIPSLYQAGEGFWPTPTDGDPFLYCVATLPTASSLFRWRSL